MRHNSSPSSGSAGFTLIELLVVITLLGFIGLILTGGLRFGARVWERSAQAVLRHGDLDPVQGFLRTLIAGARAIDGGGSQLNIVAPLPPVLGLPGLFDIRLRVSSSDRLTVAWRRRVKDETAEGQSSAGAPPADLTPADETELARGVQALDVSFIVRGAAASPEGPKWVATLPPRSAPPALVRIDLRLPPDDPRRWPVLLIAPAIDVPLQVDP